MAFPWADCQGTLEHGANFCLRGAMSETEAERKKRLAEALRTNLRRRKAQARESDAAGKTGAAGKARD